MDGHQGVVAQLQPTKAAQVREDVIRQVDESVAAQVQALKAGEGAPAQRGGQVFDGRMIVE